MRITVNGVELEVEVHGDSANPAIVLMRGLGTQLIDWPRSFIDGLLTAGLRVVVFDNRDVGLSQKFEGLPDIGKVAVGEEAPPYTLDDMAADVVGILDALDIELAHLFAISMGGMIGQVVAAKYGDRLKTFFSVMSSSVKPGLPGRHPRHWRPLMPRLRRMQALMKLSRRRRKACVCVVHRTIPCLKKSDSPLVEPVMSETTPREVQGGRWRRWWRQVIARNC